MEHIELVAAPKTISSSGTKLRGGAHTHLPRGVSALILDSADKNVIKIYHNELVKVFMENRVHESRESRRCICETKGHDGVFIATVASDKGCLWNILLSDLYLMVTHSQVKLGEYRGSSKLIKKIIDVRNWIFVLDGFLVKRTIVDYESLRLILLCHKQGHPQAEELG